jgi:hypothetical protein
MSLATFKLFDVDGNALPAPKRDIHKELAKYGMTRETYEAKRQGGMDSKRYNEVRAIAYAKWLAERDGIELPKMECRVVWSGFVSGSKTRKRTRWDGSVEVNKAWCNRISAVEWGREHEVYNTLKNGRRGAWLYNEFRAELTIEIPHWDFEPQVIVDIADDRE